MVVGIELWLLLRSIPERGMESASLLESFSSETDAETSDHLELLQSVREQLANCVLSPQKEQALCFSQASSVDEYRQTRSPLPFPT